MTNSQTGVGRTDPMCSFPVVTASVVSQLMDSQSLDPVKTMLEHLVASMARFEARMDAFDRRPSSSRHPHRPDPDPPYNISSTRSVEASLPITPSFPAVNVAIPSLPLSASAAPFLGFHEGFRPNPNGPPGFSRAQLPQPPNRWQSSDHPSSWDLPSRQPQT